MQKVNLFLTIIASVFLFANCGGESSSTGEETKEVKDSWPQSEKDAFLENCISSAVVSFSEEDAKKYCDCAMEKIIAQYPTTDEAKGITADVMMKLAGECIESLGIEPKESATADNWPQSEKDAFMTNCIAGASEKVGEERAKDYCDCALHNILVKFPDYSTAGNITADDMAEAAANCQ